MSLKEKIKIRIIRNKGNMYYFKEEDVKEAILKLEQNIIKYSENRDELITIGRGEVLRLINEIFGDFKE